MTQPDPVAAPVGDQHRGPRIGFAAQHLPGIDDVRVLRALDCRPAWEGAGGHDDGIRFVGGDGVEIGPTVLDDSDAGARRLAFQVGDDAAELGPPRQHLREQGLATESPALLQQGDVMSTFGRNRGRLESRRSAAGDEDAPRHRQRGFVCRRQARGRSPGAEYRRWDNPCGNARYRPGCSRCRRGYHRALPPAPALASAGRKSWPGSSRTCPLDLTPALVPRSAAD